MDYELSELRSSATKVRRQVKTWRSARAHFTTPGDQLFDLIDELAVAAERAAAATGEEFRLLRSKIETMADRLKSLENQRSI
jgi:hypothetical protein